MVDDDRIFLIDTHEYLTNDTYLKSALATFIILANTVYRMSHRLGFIIISSLLGLALPISSFVLGMTQVVFDLFIRPLFSIYCKTSSSLPMHSDRSFRYRPFLDYRTQI